MCGALITGTFVMSAVGAYYLLEGKFVHEGRAFLRLGVTVGIIASIVQIFPTGDLHGKMMGKYQPVTVAAMEGLFRTQSGAPMVILGQPDAEHERIDNPIIANKVLSFLLYGTTTATVKGLNEFPKSDWPTNVPLVYYTYHIMVGLGTIFLAVMALSAFLLWRGLLYKTRWMLWIILCCLPFPHIANTAGWITAEVGRQPWIVYGLLRTAAGYSNGVQAGNSLFTLIGFMGLYTILAILFLFLVYRVVAHGPVGEAAAEIESGTPITVA